MESAPHFRRAFRLLLLIGLLGACRSASSPTAGAAVDGSPTQWATPTRSAVGLTPEDFAFPTTIDPVGHYLFYLHGRILEDQGLPAVSAEFGEYEYLPILEALSGYGLVVISELRPKDTDAQVYAARLAIQIGELTTAGVPPGSITVVGASKGAAIAVLASQLLGDPELRYVLLGTCHPDTLKEWEAQGITLTGNVLAIRDVADLEYAGSCEPLFASSEGKGLSRHEELVLHVGTGHGILYAPLAEWLEPAVQWAKMAW